MATSHRESSRHAGTICECGFAARDANELAAHISQADLCLECGNSTAPGSGRFVNRIPIFGIAADGKETDGWRCEECELEIERGMA